MADNNSTYTEVLSVKVPTSEFAAGVKTLIAEWQKFVQAVGKDNVGAAIGTGMFGEISKSLNDIKELLVSVSTAVNKNVDAISTTTTKALGEVKSAAEQAAEAAEAATEKMMAASEKVARRNEKRVRDFKESKEQALESATNFDKQSPVRSFSESIEKANSLAEVEEDKRNFRRARNSQELLEKSHEEAINFDRIRTENQTRLREAASIEEQKSNFTRARDYDEKLTQAHIQAIDEDTSRNQKRVRSFNEQIEKAHSEAIQENIRRSTPEEAEGAPDYTFRRVRPGEEVDAAHTAALREQERIQEKANKGSLFGNLGDDFANIAKITLEFKAINAVLERIAAIASAPFKAFAEGEEYLKKTQQDATNLEASLLSSVRFSSDLAANFKDVQTGSVAVAKALQDIVINSPGLKLQDVTSSFKIISESVGGVGGIDTLQKMLDLTQQFSVAIRASGVDVQVTRRLASELPKLFSGTLEANSPLARILGKSNIELKQMVADGIKFNDLQERLAPLLASVAAQLKDSKDTLESTEERADLLAKRLESAYATTGVKAYQEELQRLITKMSDPSFAKHAEELGKWAKTWGEIKAAISSIPAFGAFLSAGQDNLAKEMGFIPKAGGGYVSANSPEGKREVLRNSVRKKLLDLGLNPDDDPDKDILGQKLDATGPKPDLTKKKAAPFDVSDISTHLADYREKLQEVTVAFEHAKQAEDELVSNGQENKTKESFNVRVAAAGSSAKALVEYNKILQQLNKDHANERGSIFSVSAENKKIKGKETDSETIAKDLHEADKRFENAKIEAKKNYTTTIESLLAQEVSAEKAANTEIQEIRKANFEASMEMAKKLAEFNTAIAENNARNVEQGFGAGLQSQQDVFEAKRDSLFQKRNALNTESDTIESEYLNRIAETSAGTPNRVSATNKYNSAQADLNLKYLNIGQELKALDLEIYAIEQRTNEARSQFLEKAIQLTLQYREAQEAQRFSGQQLTDRATGRNTDSRSHFAELEAIRSEQIASQARQGNVLLDKYSKTKDETQRLAIVNQILEIEQRINELKSGRVSDANAQLSDIDNDGGSRTIRNIRKRKSLGVAREGALDAGDTESAAALDKEINGLKGGFSQLKDNLEDLVPGIRSVIDVLDSNASAFDKATAAVEGFMDVVASVQDAIATFQQGKAKGGTLGGVGAVVTKYSDLAGPFAPYVKAAGEIMTLIGGIFTKQAQHVVDNVNNQFNFTLRQLQNGQEGINNTLNAVVSERQQAITQLSGIKGGQDQLKNILPQLDAEIAQLQQQQRQISIDFANSYNELALQVDTGSSLGSQIMQNWIGINQQVYNYVNATGDATSATKFLSLTLQQLQITSQQQLNQGEQQAISDALSLNQLLLQRTQLIESLNEQVFALQNQDSEERTNAGSVTRAQQIQLLQQQSQQQLRDLNFQIDKTQQVVTAESAVFSIANSIYDLHTEDNKLTLETLATQLDGYKQLQAIIASITQGTNGLFSSTTQWLNPITNPVINGQTLNLQPGSINITIVSEGGDVNNVTADSIMSALAQAARSGSPTA